MGPRRLRGTRGTACHPLPSSYTPGPKLRARKKWWRARKTLPGRSRAQTGGSCAPAVTLMDTGAPSCQQQGWSDALPLIWGRNKYREVPLYLEKQLQCRNCPQI